MFKDRADAGHQLAEMLCHLKEDPVVVLGVARGGVVVAKPVALALNAPLSVLVVRKIGAPGQPELAIGAVGPDEKLVWNETLLEQNHFDPEFLESIVREKVGEVRVRKKAFGFEKMPELKGKTVVVVDDGIATGASLKAGLMWLEKKEPKKIVVAVGCASPDAAEEIRQRADEFVCPKVSPNFYAVGQFYEDFRQVTTDEVKGLLQ